MKSPRSILITGAGSGIGEALARQYAATGIGLALTDLRADRLKAVAGACRESGAEVRTAVLEITDTSAVSEWVLTVDAARPLDLVIASAGIAQAHAIGSEGETPSDVERTMRINFGGVCNTLLPLVPAMRRRRRGQLALMSSIIALRGLPYAPAYSASKAALRAYGEALGSWLRTDGIEVTVIMPGFVETSLTQQIMAPKPFQMTAERAARIIARRLEGGRRSIIFPFRLHAGMRLLAVLPSAAADRFLATISVTHQR